MVSGWQSFDVPARSGKGLRVKKGALIRLTDIEGQQPIDFWAFNASDTTEYLSCQHTKPAIEKLFPRVGDAAYTNHRQKIMSVVEDHSPGQHDMEFAACDKYRYAQLGHVGPHASCHDNMMSTARELAFSVVCPPQPWNLFTNFFIQPDGRFTIKPPDTKPGDNIVLRAEMDAFLIVSACPQDMNMTCGGNPTGIRLEVS
jgi:uncharacterized protein YcgI (DUF1989 family)